ncbi:conserved hypothetical protein [Leishmania mexicana MHOM/GT/2001/U1103]|uniref:Uncharacterized protein n=1 Tax=Leishmania mexicana (strain MHOM/GT/2001/U1103) TaxID=929439 RepID=E9B4C9_LEIMU|nr:conserved hypothetical protein [Leishmania mexicana MHOM/GT/2001/U1103]CBZ30097.1 conserved hypothetical protein [Leishmania mexicana MHOM/GT/2001/U1103]
MASASALGSSSSTSPPRHWGSDLLLRKVPLYAQARQYAAVDPDDPRSEGNTLGYGSSSYPLLAAVRSCYNMLNGDEVAAETLGLGAATAVVDRSPFSGIDRAGYAHVPAQRKWTVADPLAADLASPNSEQSTALVRRAAAAALLDNAIGPATLAQMLEPWFGIIEDRLCAGAQQQQLEELARSEKQKRGREAAKRSNSGAAGALEEGDTVVNNSVRVADADASRMLRRKRIYDREEETHGVVYTRLESTILHYSAATQEEKEVLRSIRVASNDSSTDALVPGEGSTAALPSQETWGSRMLSLVTSTVASEAGSGAVRRSDEEVEQQQKVLAYLKRVRWIATQWNSTTNQMAFKDAGASAPSWGQMTEAQRVKTEMLHAQGQRRRFRRPRRGGDGGAKGNGDDADAALGNELGSA